MLERLLALPDVVAAGCVNWLPLGDQYNHGDFKIAGGPTKPGLDADKTAVSPGYFRVMGIRLLRGREFSEQDDASSPGVVIVSRTVARVIDPSEDVLGKQVNIWTSTKPEVWRTIVGVVDDVKQLGPTQKSHPAIYQPYPQVSRPFFLSTMTYLVRTGSDPLAAVPAMRSVLRAVDRDQPATAIGLLTDSLDRHTSEPGFYAKLLGVFALVAVLLAVVGTYGVIAYGVAQRHHEIGVRMALGARDASVLWLVIRGTLALAAAGVAVGTGVAWLATRLLKTVLFEVTPTDPATFAAVALTVFVAALLAGLIPARRATRVDPLVALRHE
jgi:putative ABC transport system permease protein